MLSAPPPPGRRGRDVHRDEHVAEVVGQGGDRRVDLAGLEGRLGSGREGRRGVGLSGIGPVLRRRDSVQPAEVGVPQSTQQVAEIVLVAQEAGRASTRA